MRCEVRCRSWLPPPLSFASGGGLPRIRSRRFPTLFPLPVVFVPVRAGPIRVLPIPFAHVCGPTGLAPMLSFGGCFWRQLNAAMTMGFLLPSAPTAAVCATATTEAAFYCPPVVFERCDGFQMRRVAARFDAAQMVERKPFRDRADVNLIGGAMCSHHARKAWNVGSPITLLGQAFLPNPARR